MVATSFLWLLMLVATVTDVWRRKIYNWTTYTGILLALGLAALATWLGRNELAEIEILQSAIGFFACGSIMLLCFVLFQVGGGDVKLLAMIGAFLGVELGIEALLWTFVIAGASAIIVLIWKIGAMNLAKRAFHQISCRMGFGKWDALSKEEQTHLKMDWFLAPAALVAVAIVKFSLFK